MRCKKGKDFVAILLLVHVRDVGVTWQFQANLQEFDSYNVTYSHLYYTKSCDHVLSRALTMEVIKSIEVSLTQFSGFFVQLLRSRASFVVPKYSERCKGISVGYWYGLSSL